MKIDLYVNWQNKEILKKEEYEEKIFEYAKEQENDDFEFDEFINAYLEEKSTWSNKFVYLFNMSEEERKKIFELWKKNCLEMARGYSGECYKMIEIEL